MSDPSYEMQVAIVAALKLPGALPGVVAARIYDLPPAAATYPYITLGPMQVLPDKADCIDGAELFQQIDVWSISTGFGEAKTIARAIVAKLDDQPLIVPGHDVVLFEHRSTNYQRDPEGKTSHAALSFRALTTPV